MRFRHASALALTGWYLLQPPVFMYKQPYTLTKSFAVEDAPLSKWNSQAFESAADCKREMARLQLLDPGPCSKNDSLGALGYALCRSDYLMVCIASDDPRLKG